MTIRNVGPSATYPTIAAAVAASASGDTIRLAAGYSNERAVLTVQDLIVQGGEASLNIDLVLGNGIGDVTLSGLADIDVFDNGGSNVITGNRGGNTLRVSGGADVVLGGGGRDTLIVNYADAVTDVVGTVGSITDGGTNSVSFEQVEDFIIYTGSGDDTVTTGDGDNLLRTSDGNDTITTGAGDSLVESGDGNDTIEVGHGHNTVNAGRGDDTVTTGDGGNRVLAGQGNNTVTTGGGADQVYSGTGDDTLETGAGRDSVQVSGGIDTADAGVGHDLLTVDYADLSTNVMGRLSAGSVAGGYSGLVGDNTVHSVTFTGVEDFHITTGSGNDDVRTGGGDDTLIGRLGDDFFHGSTGNDVLVGGAGADTLSGGRDADFLTGGQGVDSFRFDDLDSIIGTNDLIRDLSSNDSIDLSRIDADVTTAGDQSFVLVGSFSGTAGEANLRYVAADDVTRLTMDTDGDGAANIAIIAAGDHRTFDSFVL
ncbi:calcium-binding protein [Ramlibacter sp. PS3R-8]|uniref:calcium-binding protein n=1 Tax=Ramlibacter sp. PS3R-8 TaxID=3133437 RepID=UPI0030AE2C83